MAYMSDHHPMPSLTKASPELLLHRHTIIIWSPLAHINLGFSKHLIDSRNKPLNIYFN